MREIEEGKIKEGYGKDNMKRVRNTKDKKKGEEEETCIGGGQENGRKMKTRE